MKNALDSRMQRLIRPTAPATAEPSPVANTVSRDGWHPYHPNPFADEVIAHHLREVVDRIRAQCNPKSILLTGSFGRGEGSVLVRDRAVELLSDVEIAVVSKYPKERARLREISSSVTGASGIETCIFWLRPDSLKRWRIKSLSFGRQPLSVKVYDILGGSQLLWGEPIDTPVPDPALIPRWEGLRLIFNRMIETLLVDSDAPDPAREAKMTSKLVLACVDALLVDQHLYQVRSDERVSRFQNHAHSFSFLKSEDVLRTCRLAEWAVGYKLEPHSISATDSLVLRTAARKFTDQTFRYLVRRELALEFASYEDGIPRYVDAVQNRRDYIDYRLGALTTPLFPNLIYSRKLKASSRWVARRRLRDYFVPWDQIIYATGATLFHALDPEGDVDRAALTTARGLLERLVRLPERQEDETSEFALLTEVTCDLWKRLLC